MTKNIILIGLSGSGKTTYGQHLSEKLKRPWYDIDHLIELKEGMTVSNIFEMKGESYFRRIEWEIFNECLQLEAVVISTGGGLVPYAVANHCKKPFNGFFIYLNPDLEVIVKRLENPAVLSKRPLLAAETNLREKIARLHEKRSEAYLAWADAIITNT